MAIPASSPNGTARAAPVSPPRASVARAAAAGRAIILPALRIWTAPAGRAHSRATPPAGRSAAAAQTPPRHARYRTAVPAERARRAERAPAVLTRAPSAAREEEPAWAASQ